MREHFSKALEQLQCLLAEQAAAAENAVAEAIEAVAQHNSAHAAKIIDGDLEIDCQEITIEEECLKLLALYQPVAVDLRTVITILKVNNELERVADLAVNIAQRAVDMASFPEEKIEKFDFSQMFALARQMLKKALDALVYHDTRKAADVIDSDDAVDDIHKDNYGKVKAMMISHPEEASYYLDCLTVSRALERIADIATNICEDIIYLQEGKIVRHSHCTGKEVAPCQKKPS
ncbi:MAG: phosphate signaling complex protein PhoU [Lentisphaeria bacterium]